MFIYALSRWTKDFFQPIAHIWFYWFWKLGNIVNLYTLTILYVYIINRYIIVFWKYRNISVQGSNSGLPTSSSNLLFTQHYPKLTLVEVVVGGHGIYLLFIAYLLIFVTRLSRRARYPTTVTDFMSLTGVESRMSCVQYEYRNHYSMKADCIHNI